MPGRGGPGEEGGLAPLVARRHRGIPGNSSKSWRLNPAATLSKPLPAPLGPGSLPLAWAWALDEDAAQPGARVRPCGASKVWLNRYGRFTCRRLRGAASHLNNPLKQILLLSFFSRRSRREIAEISLPGEPDFRSLSLNDCALDHRGRAVKGRRERDGALTSTWAPATAKNWARCFHPVWNSPSNCRT